MNEPKADYISILADRFAEPIVTLLDRLFATPYPGRTDVQTGARENGYAISICLLLVVMLESFILYARLITQAKSRSDERSALNFFRNAYPRCPLLDDVVELFALRDAIAHNRLWRIQFATSRGRWMKLLDRFVDIQQKRWLNKNWKTVDEAQGVTQKLKLNVQPTMIDRFDVVVVLHTVLAVLTFINEQEGGRLGIHSLRGDFLGEEDVDLWHVQSRVRDRLTSCSTGSAGPSCSPPDR